MAYKDEETRIAKSREYYLANKERINVRNRNYYKDNAEKLRKYAKDYREANYEQALESSRQSGKRYYRANKDKVRERSIRLWQKLKQETFEVLGGAICVKCDFKDVRALQIDHLNGGGRKHMKGFSSNKTYLKYVRENPEEFQVLCANCNWIKVSENRELYAKD